MTKRHERRGMFKGILEAGGHRVFVRYATADPHPHALDRRDVWVWNDTGLLFVLDWCPPVPRPSARRWRS